MDFAERLKGLRKRLKLSQAEMGKRLRCSGNYIHLLEKGEKQPSDFFLERLDLVERGVDAIEAIQSPAKPEPEPNDKGTPYQTDIEWLVAHGYSESLASMARILRQEFEKKQRHG